VSVLTFHRSLYSVPAVRAAAEAYAELASSIDVVEHEVEVVVTITDPDPDLPELVDAFANHALFETIAARGA